MEMERIEPGRFGTTTGSAARIDLSAWERDLKGALAGCSWIALDPHRLLALVASVREMRDAR